MDLTSIRHALKEQPFDLCRTDGRRVAVKHPEFVPMNQRIVIITDEESATKFAEPLFMMSIEPPGRKGNGTQIEKPKS